MKNISYILLLFITFFYSQTQAEVYISSTMSTDPASQSIIVNAGSYQIIPLPGTGNPTDSFKISIDTANEVYRDLTAFIVDEDNLTSFKQGYRYRGIGYSRAPTPFVISGSIPTTGRKYLLIDNTYALLIKKKVNFSVVSEFQINDKQQEKVKAHFKALYSNLKKNLLFPDFNIHIEKCSEANAYSDSLKGDIHLCSELIDQLSKNSNEKAVLGIFLHEVGHSLLGLWGIPGNNNEDIADEFSTYMLMSEGPNGYAYLDATLQFWQGKNSAEEALNMLQNGDRHSLSIQRMRNIKENMLTGEAFIKKWNRLIYEHHTDEALKEVIKKPMPGADIELATKILMQRATPAN